MSRKKKLKEKDFLEILKTNSKENLELIKPRTSEERFAIQALKELCHTDVEYQFAPYDSIYYAVYCFDCRDQDWYIRYFAKMLSLFKPLWCNLNDRDFLREKLGIVFLKRKEDAIGLNLRGIMVSKKWIDFLTNKYSVNGFEMNCKVLSDWYETMEYFERRMSSRFRNNYFIWMGSEENAAFIDADVKPRVIDLDDHICKSSNWILKCL